MGLIKNILMIVIIFVILVFVFNWITKKDTSLSSMTRADTHHVVVKHKHLPKNNSSDFTYSIWFFIDDWNTNYGEMKNIYYQGSPPNKNAPAMAAVLDPYENDIRIFIETHTNPNDPVKKLITDDHIQVNLPSNNFTSDGYLIPNIPLQKWVNLIMSVNGRTLDVYLDGKLVKTYILPGVARTDTSDDIIIGNSGELRGFSGWTSKFQYFANSSNPLEAYDIYKKGPGTSLFSNLFNKYRLKIAFMEYNTEKTSFEI